MGGETSPPTPPLVGEGCLQLGISPNANVAGAETSGSREKLSEGTPPLAGEGSGERSGIPRLAELLLASLGLALIWPLLAFLCLLIRLESPGSPIFTQRRVGLGGRPFTVYKLRSMRSGLAPPSLAVADFQTFLFTPMQDPRRTRVGTIVRVTSLDEVPQLLNVIRGEMALVGPRPEVPEVVKQYPPAYHERHRVRPGLTGLAQVHGRSDLTVGHTIAHDIAYARTRSPRLDLTLLSRTIGPVFRRKGAR